ncbi:hypothetical protein AB0C38_35005 [Amycolatopsis sp. NPDC048633]|uniref:hypothetical protein n=1 Tax=Amycolatopsis sp. NPDC048633 TaxID=3157095 RepID=UPI00340935F0
MASGEVKESFMPLWRAGLTPREGVAVRGDRAAVAQAQQFAQLDGQPDTEFAAGVGEFAGAQRLARAAVPERGLELVEPGHAGNCDRLAG